MFTKTISTETKTILALLGKSNLLKDAYLAGGTALALQLGHRLSFDLDFFTATGFNSLDTADKLQKAIGLKIQETKAGTIIGTVQNIKFSLLFYQHKLLFPSKKFLGISISDIKDIAAMKIVAASDRGVKRDFIDLYFICRKISLENVLKLYNKKYGKLASNLIHILKSLVYFKDAAEEPMPKMLRPCKWNEVKNFFKQEVKRLSDKLIQ